MRSLPLTRHLSMSLQPCNDMDIVEGGVLDAPFSNHNTPKHISTTMRKNFPLGLRAVREAGPYNNKGRKEEHCGKLFRFAF